MPQVVEAVVAAHMGRNAVIAAIRINTVTLSKQGNCKWCGKLGHHNDTCFQTYPNKKPKWLKLKGSKTSETSVSNLEVTLASVEDFQ
jgi:hypothetical protein